MNFKDRAEALQGQLAADRHYLHQHAELSFQEHETTAYLAGRLREMGIPVQTFADYTGCIATIQGGQPGEHTVLLRADIDALPIRENSGVDFCSLHPGVMHACGHDCHAAMLLTAAQLLWEQRDQLHGRVKLLFQAAEEVFVGSHYYVDQGHLEGVDAAMGMHVWPTAPSGKLVILDGELMASCDNFKLTVHGVSAHGSTPQKGKDAIVAASAIITSLQTLASRVNDPRNALVISVGTVRAGTQFNIIADTAVLEGTVRCYSPETRAMVEDEMRRITSHTAEALGCRAELEYHYLEPSVRNDDLALNALARASAVKLFGPEVLAQAAPASGSEDFSYIMERIPHSLFVFLGYHDEAQGCIHGLHNERFCVDEAILPVGAAQYAQFAADYLEQTAGGAL